MKKELEEAISRFNSKHIELNVIKKLPSGKEAEVYLVESKTQLFALKVYKERLKRSFKNDQVYTQGKFYRRASERKAVRLNTGFGKALKQRLWIKREFYLLKKLFDAGANIPEPIEMVPNAILMKYIGDREHPAPLLKDATLTPKQIEKYYKVIKQNIDIFWKNGIVHGDLSEYNILYWKGKIYIIDFPQSVDVRNNSNAEALLARDKKNIDSWYQKVKKEV